MEARNTLRIISTELPMRNKESEKDEMGACARPEMGACTRSQVRHVTGSTPPYDAAALTVQDREPSAAERGRAGSVRGRYVPVNSPLARGLSPVPDPDRLGGPVCPPLVHAQGSEGERVDCRRIRSRPTLALSSPCLGPRHRVAGGHQLHDETGGVDEGRAACRPGPVNRPRTPLSDDHVARGDVGMQQCVPTEHFGLAIAGESVPSRLRPVARHGRQWKFPELVEYAQD